MEENSNIFLASGDALVYLAEPMHEKYSTKFVWVYPFNTHVSYDHFFNSPSPVRTLTHFGWLPLPLSQLRRSLMDGLFLNQSTNNNIPISNISSLENITIIIICENGKF